MIIGPIGYLCIILYDQSMTLRTLNFSDLLYVVFGYRVSTSQKCIFFFLFVCFPFFVFEKHTYLSAFSWENGPHTHPFSGLVCLSLRGKC